MKLNFTKYEDKVRACWIGKNIGGTMGTPYEGGRELLDVKGFATKPGNPLPNDDLDLQLVWLHALENLGSASINATTLGELWLNFITPHWNEYGIGKANMKRGLIPPLAADADNTWSHSNGAWIRTEIWACTAPAIPTLAAKHAIEDAKVDHGAGEGTYAAAFVAAMQAAAFVLDSIYDCIDVGLAAIPEGCRVAQSVKFVIDSYRAGRDWKLTRSEIINMNADIGDGWFEAPSNVAFVILGLVYGEGDFKKSVITAINCGDDTDCTAATVGATLGILQGMRGIPTDWAEYIGDNIITISLSMGCEGRRSFPASCSELSKRVTDVAPTVVKPYNCYRRQKSAWVDFADEGEDIPSDIKAVLMGAVKGEIRRDLEALRPNTMRFKHAFLTADVTLSATEIAPMGEIGVEMRFESDPVFENQPYSGDIRWILPEGFSVSGKNALFLPQRNAHTRGNCKMSFTLQAGDAVKAQNRIVAEITFHGRHTAMYVSFIILG